jgi:hypothetical protein
LSSFIRFMTATDTTPLYDALIREYRRALRATPGDRSDEPVRAVAGFTIPAQSRRPPVRRDGASGAAPTPPRMFAPAVE